VLRTTSYLADVLSTLRAEGPDADDEMTARLTPAQNDHINFYGTCSFGLDTNSAANDAGRCASQPDATGWTPRQPDSFRC
jgi:Tn3 transposase DDE domain